MQSQEKSGFRVSGLGFRASTSIRHRSRRRVVLVVVLVVVWVVVVVVAEVVHKASVWVM